MIWRNLTRRKGRTLLTLAGIALGAAAIVALGALAEGMRSGYTAMARGSQADLVLTQSGVMDVTMGRVSEDAVRQVASWPEVAAVDGVVVGNVQAESAAYFFLFGYDPAGFTIKHFGTVEGQGLGDVRRSRGKPLVLGRGAADSLNKGVGDILSVQGTAFRIVGIYETGDAFEEGGALIARDDAQTLLSLPNRYSSVYIRLRSPDDEARLRTRVERAFTDLELSSTTEFGDRQQLIAMFEGFTVAVAVLAVIIGGVGMTNTLFMSVFERTREIGLLRAVGWGRGRVLRLILGESLLLSLLGGLLGIGLGVAAAGLLRGLVMGSMGVNFSPALFARALITVALLGLVGGAYPAWWAGRLLPLEALRYEGGTGDSGRGSRVWGGLAVRNLLRRRTRTALTLLGISVGIAAIVALSGISQGMTGLISDTMTGTQADVMVMEAGVSDMGYSAIDQRLGTRLAAWPGVESVAGLIINFTSTDKMPLLILWGYHPREFGMDHLRLVEGQPLTGRHQAMVGRQAVDQLGVDVGDTLRLMGSNFRVVGIYETGVSYEDSAVVIGLREAQALAGKPHQVMWYGLKLQDPSQATQVRAELEAAFPDLDFSLSSDIGEVLPDMRTMDEWVGQISGLAILIGAVGMLNTMLMSVMERTREIGVLRAVGWQRRQVLRLIVQEALVLGLAGAAGGIALGLGLAALAGQVPAAAGLISARYAPDIFVRALLLGLVSGVVGGLYPAWRATRMRPVEALRYE